MDLGQFTWTNLIASFALLLTGGSMLIGVWWTLEIRVRAVENAASEKLRQARDEAAKERTRIERDLTEFKIHVVEKYASWETVEKAHKRLEDRLETLTADVSKMPDIMVERIMKFMQLK